MENQMIRGIIYKYTSPSNKVYIGQTINEKDRRRKFLNKENVSYSGPKINKAIEKYGAKNFKYEIIFAIESYNKDEIIKILNEKEKYFIKLFDSIDNGYNLSEGGRTNNFISEESKQSRINKIQKPILQYNLEGEFIREWKSSKEAADTLNISSGNICQVLKKVRYQSNGYIFIYKTGEISQKIQITPTKQQKKIILQLRQDGTIIKEFPSIQDAAREAGVDRTTMSRYVNNHVDSLKHTGFIWRKKYD